MKSVWKKGFLLIGATALSFSLIGCQKQDPHFTEKEEVQFMKSYMEMATKPSEPTKVMEKLNANILKLSDKNASNAIDGLLFSMYQEMAEMNTQAEGLQKQFQASAKKGIDFNQLKQTDKIEDAVLKSFVQKAIKNNLKVIKQDDQYTLQPNMDVVMKQYGKHMESDLKAMVAFSQEEYQHPFFNQQLQDFDYDLVVKRILVLEKNMKKYSKSYYHDSFAKSKNYYYQVYFGMNSDFLTDTQKVVKPNVLQHYEKVIKEQPDTQLAKDLKAYTDKLKTTNHKVTDDVYAFLADLTQMTVPINNTTPSTQTKQSVDNASTDDVKKAVKEAIKENDK